MPSTIIVGGQYGSEGKGKVVALTAGTQAAAYLIAAGMVTVSVLAVRYVRAAGEPRPRQGWTLTMRGTWTLRWAPDRAARDHPR